LPISIIIGLPVIRYIIIPVFMPELPPDPPIPPLIISKGSIELVVVVPVAPVDNPRVCAIEGTNRAIINKLFIFVQLLL
jgi:hypothetical protein